MLLRLSTDPIDIPNPSTEKSIEKGTKKGNPSTLYVGSPSSASLSSTARVYQEKNPLLFYCMRPSPEVERNTHAHHTSSKHKSTK